MRNYYKQGGVQNQGGIGKCAPCEGDMEVALVKVSLLRTINHVILQLGYSMNYKEEAIKMLLLPTHVLHGFGQWRDGHRNYVERDLNYIFLKLIIMCKGVRTIMYIFSESITK